jgi:prepilin-type N-terminal cleavage/methylation domain-containing protein
VRKNRSFTLIELLVVVAIIAMLVGMLLPSLARARETVRKATCASNLRQVGAAMHQYAQANGDVYPTLQKPANIIGTDVVGDPPASFKNLTRNAEDDPHVETTVADKPVSSNLWLLCRGQLATPAVFLCPSQSRKAGIDISELMKETDGTKRGARYFSDFPSHPVAGPMISYSFHMPWSNTWNSLSPGPGFILAGDENNGADVLMYWNTTKDPKCWWNSTTPSVTEAKKNQKKIVQAANSTSHKSEGQNVLDSTAAVSFKTDVHCGLNRDNVYASGLKSVVRGKVANAGTPTQNPMEDTGLLDVRSIDVSYPQSSVPDTVLIPITSSVLGKWATAP